jgi:hypothetical protein
VRRGVMTGLVTRAGAGALVAALAATHASAQSSKPPVSGLRPAFEDAGDEADNVRTKPPLRRDRQTTTPGGTQAAGTLPTFGNPENSQIPSFGNPAGSGAGRTGFMSTNTRRPGTPSRTIVRVPGTLTPPLPLSGAASTAPAGPPGSFSTTTPPTGAKINPADSRTTKAIVTTTVPPALTPPRAKLVRIPDGTATGGIAGTVNTAVLQPNYARLLRRRVTTEDDPYAQLGLRGGAFIVLPAVEVTGGYDTNPGRVPNARAAFFGTVAPEVLAKSDWTRHEVTATLRGSYTAYDQTPELDRPSLDGKVTGRLDVTRDTSLIGEGTLVVGTDNPGSPNVQAGLTRFPIFTTLGGSAGVTQRFNRIEVTAKGTAERTEYQDSSFTDGTTGSNADRDYNRFGGTLRTSYDLMPGLKPFVEVSADSREHDIAVDRFGLQRDSTGWTLKGGSTFEFSRKLTGEAALGYLERNYKDPTLKQLQGFTFDASLIYAMSALTNVKLTAATVAQETTVPGTAGVLTRNTGIEVDHAFRRWLIGAIKVSYGFDDYVGSDRKDDRYAVSAAITYKLNRDMQVKGEVREEWLRSTTPIGVDYNATVFLLGMRMQR